MTDRMWPLVVSRFAANVVRAFVLAEMVTAMSAMLMMLMMMVVVV